MSDTFKIGDFEFEYERSDDNTRNGERTVEVPVFRAVISEALKEYKHILEIGNVLKKYTGHAFPVIDAHELAEGVTNADAEFYSCDKTEVILSVSTIEHFGHDMGEVKDHEKIKRFFTTILERFPALKVLGFSFPIGFNHVLDDLVRAAMSGSKCLGPLSFSECQAMRRISAENEWQVCEPNFEAKYGEPYEYGNCLLFVFMERDE